MGTESVTRTGTEHTISTADYTCKLRMDSSGVALAHQDVDNNFDVLRRQLNSLITDLDNITEGVLANVTSASLVVDAIADDAVDTAQIANDAVTVDQIADDAVETAQIKDGEVTYAKIQDVSATNKFLGKDTAGAGPMEEFGPTSARTMLNVEDGANNYTLPTASLSVKGGLKLSNPTPKAITAATNASPIAITSTAHELTTGDFISVSGVLGNIAANGTFGVTVVDANSFTMDTSTGNGVYTGGGTWLILGAHISKDGLDRASVDVIPDTSGAVSTHFGTIKVDGTTILALDGVITGANQIVPATTSVLGGIIVGNGLEIDSSGNLDLKLEVGTGLILDGDTLTIQSTAQYDYMFFVDWTGTDAYDSTLVRNDNSGSGYTTTDYNGGTTIPAQSNAMGIRIEPTDANDTWLTVLGAYNWALANVNASSRIGFFIRSTTDVSEFAHWNSLTDADQMTGTQPDSRPHNDKEWKRFSQIFFYGYRPSGAASDHTTVQGNARIQANVGAFPTLPIWFRGPDVWMVDIRIAYNFNANGHTIVAGSQEGWNDGNIGQTTTQALTDVNHLVRCSSGQFTIINTSLTVYSVNGNIDFSDGASPWEFTEKGYGYFSGDMLLHANGMLSSASTSSYYAFVVAQDGLMTTLGAPHTLDLHIVATTNNNVNTTTAAYRWSWSQLNVMRGAVTSALGMSGTTSGNEIGSAPNAEQYEPRTFWMVGTGTYPSSITFVG